MFDVYSRTFQHVLAGFGVIFAERGSCALSKAPDVRKKWTGTDRSPRLVRTFQPHSLHVLAVRSLRSTVPHDLSLFFRAPLSNPDPV